MISKDIAVIIPVLSSIQQLPQLYKSYTTNRVEDLSIESLAIILLTNILWFFHGYFIRDFTLIISAVASILINTALISLCLSPLKIKNGQNAHF
jgi:uncharacterized protein with PQ loop repeat